MNKENLPTNLHLKDTIHIIEKDILSTNGWKKGISSHEMKCNFKTN